MNTPCPVREDSSSRPLSVAINADSGEKTWLTPPHIIEALGPFDLDPCCPPNMPWQTAAQMVCRPDDGLAVDWTGKRVWLNPPYGREAMPFLRKMAKTSEGGGYFAHFRAHRHICMARLDISIRIRHTFSSRPPAFLPTRRNARRDGYRAVRARCVLRKRFVALAFIKDCGHISASEIKSSNFCPNSI